jgi:sugar/nucleoside kinase (ribokinase family)
VSFDPNLRKEVLGNKGLSETVTAMLRLADVFLPSGDELHIGCAGLETAVAEHLARGIKAVVWKQGAAGASYFDARERLDQAAFAVTEVDPTGAGDCFAGAFTALWCAGAAPADALRMAAAAGALAVTRRGPMEGAGWAADVAKLAG